MVVEIDSSQSQSQQVEKEVIPVEQLVFFQFVFLCFPRVKCDFRAKA